jgi:tetratricopeptide (TPR) repeat protein
MMHAIGGCDNPARLADVVFVHGLGGNAFTTWRSGQGNTDSWPHWLADDYPQVGIWSLGYPAAPSKWTRFLAILSDRWKLAGHGMALPTRALQTLDDFVQRGLGKRPLFFIGHSLGGLLIKQVLRVSGDSLNPRQKEVLQSTRAVLFLATPHAGSTLASLGDKFRTLFGSTITLAGLKAHDAHLSDLFDWYSNHATARKIETYTYYETIGLKGITIVNATSARAGTGRTPVGLDEDHLSIAKPKSRESQVWAAAVDLLSNHVLRELPAGPAKLERVGGSPSVQPSSIVVKVDLEGVTRPTTRIPHELPPSANEFFGRQVELATLIRRLRAGVNAAVVGPAGFGKTALAAEALRAVTGQSESSLAGSPFTDGVVFVDLYSLRGQAEAAWNAIANTLVGPRFMEASPPHTRATEACRGRRLLIVIEGGEEADGNEGRASFRSLLSVLSPQNRWLLLTRVSTQASPGESILLSSALPEADAGLLFDSLGVGGLESSTKAQLLELVEGHPLALTWAANLLARNDEDPKRLIHDWKNEQLPALSDPSYADHTLGWLYTRSMRSLDPVARQCLNVGGCLSRSQLPLTACQAIVVEAETTIRAALKALVQRGILRRSETIDCWEFAHVLGYRFARQEAIATGGMCETLGGWLHNEFIQAATATSFQTGPATQVALGHLSALLEIDSEQVLWVPLVKYSLYEAQERLAHVGSLHVTRQFLHAIAGWMAKLPPDKARTAFWVRERTTLLNRQGDTMRSLGDLAGALVAYKGGLEARRQLAKEFPLEPPLQRDVGVSYLKVGDVLNAQGDLNGALAAYRDAVSVLAELSANDPSNTDWLRALSISQSKIGDALKVQGDQVSAILAYKEVLAVRRRLAESNPSNVTLKRDLAIGLTKLGDVLRILGDLSGAFVVYQESIEVRRELLVLEPSSAIWQRDLGVSLSKMAYVLAGQGDLPGALAANQEVLALQRKLAAADPSNLGWQRDLAVCLSRIGDMQVAQGNLSGALSAFNESLEIRRRLVGLDPLNAGWLRDLGTGLTNVGKVLKTRGDTVGALPLYEEALIARRKLAQADSTNTTWQRDLTSSLANVADLYRERGEAPRALAVYREVLDKRRELVRYDVTNMWWQRDLTYILNRVGDALTECGDTEGALALFQEALEMRRNLSGADVSNAQGYRDLFVSLTKVGDGWRARGDMDRAVTFYKEALMWSRRLSEANPLNAVWQSDVAYCLGRMAACLERSDKGEALDCAMEGLSISDYLIKLDPSNARWLQDATVVRALVAKLRGAAADPASPLA